MCVDVVFSRAMPCNDICASHVRQRNRHIPKSKFQLRKRGKKWHSHWNREFHSNTNKNCEMKMRKKNCFLLYGFCTRNSHTCFCTAKLKFLKHSLSFSHVHSTSIMGCSYRWWPVSFIVECVHEPIKQNIYVCATMCGHTKNEMHIHMSVCVLIETQFNVTISPTRSPLTTSSHGIWSLHSLRHINGIVNNFYTYYKFVPLFIARARSSFSIAARTGTFFVVARFNYDFKVCAEHVTTWMLMIAATITVIQLNAFRNYYTTRFAIAWKQQNEMGKKSHEETKREEKKKCMNEPFESIGRRAILTVTCNFRYSCYKCCCRCVPFWCWLFLWQWNNCYILYG